MTASLGTLGACFLLAATCVVVGFCAWAFFRVNQARIHRQAVSDRLNEIPHGDWPQVPSLPPVHGTEI